VARFTVALAQESRLQVQLFDVRGALVTTLHGNGAGALPRGVHGFQWDGSRPQAVSAPSGAYFVRVVATPVQGDRAQTATGKLVLIR
jgi:flagellar hook assembly protein FlgD